MTRPPEVILPPATAVHARQLSIEASLRGIRDRWPYMWGHHVHRGRAINGGSPGAGILPGRDEPTGYRANGQPYWAEDAARGDGDLPAIDRIASLRREVIEALNATCREVIEERGIEHVVTRWGGTAHTVNGRDALDLIAFLLPHAEWLATMSGDPEYAAHELAGYLRQVSAVVDPHKRDRMSLGPCPLEAPGEADVLTRCTGTVWVRLDTDSPGEADGVCSSCNEAAVWSWWEPRMYPDLEVRGTLTTAEVVTFLARAYGVAIAAATVRVWVHRGRLASCGADDQGRPLYAREAVIFAYETWRTGTRLLTG